MIESIFQLIQDGDTLVVLLCGGDKSTQSKDIEKARTYWTDYLK